MIRTLPVRDRRRRALARHQWRRLFVPIAILNIEGFGRSLVVLRTLETRWSARQARRMWQVPAKGMAV